MTAEAFLQACAVLDKAARQGEFVTVAVAGTWEAFTLELHLKSLLLLEEGLQKRGHDSFKLFKCLSPKTQAELVKEFGEYVGKWPSFAAEAEQNKYPTDLEGLLIRGRHAFEDFRYSHESLNAGSNTVWGLKGLTFIIRDRILKAKPEWENALLDAFLKGLNPHAASVEEQNEPSL
ncbi:MAG: hypothetical protein WA183_11695 [Chthoniobacterales bacterium]